MDLIGTLGTQHQLIQDAVGRLEAALGRSQSARARAALMELQNAVSAHFGLEEIELYPLLERTVLTDTDSPEAQTVRSSRTALDDVRRAVEAFFARTSDPNASLEDIAQAWGAVSTVLNSRLAAQRETYPKFRRMTRLHRFPTATRAAPAAATARPN